jgi:hypothetical protein
LRETPTTAIVFDARKSLMEEEAGMAEPGTIRGILQTQQTVQR